MTAFFKWGQRSQLELEGIHPDLRRVADRALQLSLVDFMIVDGIRTLQEQRHFVAIGTSKTMHSRHLHGFAVDFVPIINGKVSWVTADFKVPAQAFADAAQDLGIHIIRGWDWTEHWDSGHIELDKYHYPDPIEYA